MLVSIPVVGTFISVLLIPMRMANVKIYISRYEIKMDALLEEGIWMT